MPTATKLTFSIANKPGFANFNSATGQLYGTPYAEHARTWSGIEISVSDGTTQGVAAGLLAGRQGERQQVADHQRHSGHRREGGHGLQRSRRPRPIRKARR